MVSEQFRRQLRQEAKTWHSEGLISDEVYSQLSDRYQFISLETTASNRFVLILLGLGGLLLGLGIITFVAANWQGWSRSLKIAILFTSFAATNGFGFWFWRVPGDSWQSRFGQGLLLLGSLIFGANLALMSQLFHLDGELYQLYLIWGLGVLTLGISLRITALGMVAIILIAIAYGISLADWFNPNRLSGIAIALKHAPLLTGIVGIFLARWWNSRLIFSAIVLMFIPAVWIQILALGGSSIPVAVKFTIGLILPAAFLWSYRDLNLSRFAINSRSFQPIARGFSLCLLAMQLYLLSFHGWWDNWGSWDSIDDGLGGWFLGLDLLILTGLTCWQWFQLGFQSLKSSSPQPWKLSIHSILIFSSLSLTALLVLWHFLVYPLPILAPILLNIQGFLLSIELVRWGIGRAKRFGFWSGLVLLTLQIISRMLEYDTGLLLKSVVFIIGGIAVMAAGLWFERTITSMNN